MANVSLDDIIRSKSSGMRGRGGIGRHTSRGARINGSMRGRVGGMGGPQIVTDARMKIIQKNREKLTDARDKLAEIAKQSDARLKLEKIRAMQLRKEPPSLPTISRKTGRNGRLALTTNKVNPPFMQSGKVPPPLMPTNYMPPMSTRTVGYRNTIVNEPHYGEDINMDYDGDYMMDAQVLRRTVSNEYAPTLPPPPPPVFNLTQASSPFNWKATTSGNIIQENPRGTSLRKINDSDRTRDFKVVARPSSMEVKSEPRSYREDWTFGTKSRTILPEDTLDSKYYDMRNHRDIGVKSRLDAVSNKSRSMGALPRPKTSPSSGPSQSTGYRIVVSNLQANVTQEDIKELFEDVGELLVSRLVRPGTAEVIYKTLKDATKAVETYHNRQLDGHPMKCLLVNPRPKNNPTGPAVRPIAESRRNASSSYVQPSLGAVYRALFDDS